MPIKIEFNADVATMISAASSTVYAIIAAISLWLLSRQIRDARRFGAAPSLYALLKELDDHMAAIRHIGDKGVDEFAAREAISRCLEFFERVDHLRDAGVIPDNVLRRAFGNELNGLLADPRFAKVIEQNAAQYEEVLLLQKRLGQRGK